MVVDVTRPDFLEVLDDKRTKNAACTKATQKPQAEFELQTRGTPQSSTIEDIRNI
jgi:hypothetical protein